MSWSVSKIGRSDAVARALALEMENLTGEHSHLDAPERTFARMAGNLIGGLLDNIKPPMAVRVVASGSMAKREAPALEMHSLEIKVEPIFGFVE